MQAAVIARHMLSACSAVACSVQLHAVSVNVVELGAKGDGVADDSGPIRQAVTQISDAGGGEIHFPYGTYRMPRNVHLPQTHLETPPDLRTTAAGDGFFRRRLTLTNVADAETLALGAVTPLAGRGFALAEGIDLHRVVQAESGAAPYRVGWMRDTEWGQEGNFQWLDLMPQTETA